MQNFSCDSNHFSILSFRKNSLENPRSDVDLRLAKKVKEKLFTFLAKNSYKQEKYPNNDDI